VAKEILGLSRQHKRKREYEKMKEKKKMSLAMKTFIAFR